MQHLLPPGHPVERVALRVVLGHAIAHPLHRVHSSRQVLNGPDFFLFFLGCFFSSIFIPLVFFVLI